MQIKLSVFFILFLSIISLSFSKNLNRKKKRQCRPVAADCDLFHWCCDDYVCKDYRCSRKGVKENILDWAPTGFKCDWFHHCPDGYACFEHRCKRSSTSTIHDAS